MHIKFTSWKPTTKLNLIITLHPFNWINLHQARHAGSLSVLLHPLDFCCHTNTGDFCISLHSKDTQWHIWQQKSVSTEKRHVARWSLLFLFNTVIYVFLLCLCILIVCLCIFIMPAGTLQLPWLRFFRAFSSVVRQMPGYNPQRWGTARPLPKYLCCSIHCLLCVILCIVCA